MSSNEVWITPANVMLKCGANNKTKTMKLKDFRIEKAIAESVSGWYCKKAVTRIREGRMFG
jgi:hypothetical protein